MLTLIARNKSTEFFTRERCHIKEVLNDQKSPGLSIARCRVEVGVTTELHALCGTAETYLIEEGKGLMDDGVCVPFVVEAGDCVNISPGHAQRIKNTGTEELKFMVICTPGFRPACYEPREINGS